ncbi:nuclear transport factor 2 family protein [Aspergillus lucknowensis]|uniref:NTF2-related export protein n=1 Tax=Aspergillus lucknowensis TaxID=176173 RepID=A0ABR4LVS8_9EURO
MSGFADIAQQFVNFYYQTFDANRAGLAGLYVCLWPQSLQNLGEYRRVNSLEIQQRDSSMLTFETSSVQGVNSIMEKLGGLPFQKVQHQVATLDAQPSSDQGGILVLVTGALLVDEEQKPMNYTQTFQLLPDGAGSYFVFNDIFRLIYNAA